MSGGYPALPELCNALDLGTQTGTSRGTTLGTGAANTLSSWAVLGTTTADAVAMIVMPGSGSGGSHNCAWDVAVGSTGSEKVIAQNIVGTGPTNPGVCAYLLPCNIPSGTQINVRVQADVQDTGGAAPAISIIFLDGSYTADGLGGVDTIGFVAANTRGTTITANASANTKGSYAVLTTSTAHDYVGFIISPDGLNAGVASSVLLDIAIGATGSEKIILPNYSLSGQGSQTPKCFALNGMLPIPIPAGTQIQARIQGATGGTTIGLTLYGIIK